MQNATRRAQEMHFEYKYVTSFRGPPDQVLCSWTPLGLRPQTRVIGLALRARHGPLQTQLLIVQY